MATVDLPEAAPRPFEISPETRAEWQVVCAALVDWRFWLKAAIIVAAPFWIYSPVYHGDWLMDDPFYLSGNQLLYAPDRLWKAWFQPGSFIEYYPIHESFQWAQWVMWSENSFGYHLTNIFLHAFSSLLVWRLLSKFHLAWAWVGGLLFAIYPTLVESVVWVAELKNTLSLPPFIIAMCFYIEYENHSRPRDYYLALGAYVISMLCKISMAPFPALILLYAWWRRGRVGWKDILASLPFWVVAVLLTALGVWCGRIFSETHRMDISFPTGGLLFRIAIIGQTLSFYLATCLWPFGLQPMYVRWPLDHPTLLQFLPWPIFAAAIYWFWVNRAAWGRHALLGFGFFALFLAPFLGFFIISYMRLTWVMDHFVYIGIIGLIGLMVAGLEYLSARLSAAAAWLLRIAAIVGIAVLAFDSHWYAAKFIDQKTLWTYAIAANPQAYTAYNNLGAILLNEDQVEQALPLFEKALKYYPDYFEAHYNRGLALARLQRPQEAIEEYKKATLLSPENLNARLALAGELESSGFAYEAVHQYALAEEQNPQNPTIHATLGGMLIRMGQMRDAAREFGETVQLDPEAASPHNDYGNVLFVLGQREAAINEYREAIRLNPNMAEAHNNLGGALQETGHIEEAIKEFQAAVHLDPTNPKLNLNLATALAKSGRRDEAIAYFETALRYDPKNQEARQGLSSLRGPNTPEVPAK